MAEQDLGPATSRTKDVVTLDVLTARGPKIVQSATAPADTTVVWIDVS